MSLRTASSALVLTLLLWSDAALAVPRDRVTPISFSGASCFNFDLAGYPYAVLHGPDLLQLDPIGLTPLDWHITVLLTPTGFEFVEGDFTFHIGNKVLVGEYTGFTLDPITGAYTLDWVFTGGTGRMHKVTGSGRTNGLADLSTYCAEYSFSGTLIDYKNRN